MSQLMSKHRQTVCVKFQTQKKGISMCKENEKKIPQS